MNAIGRIAAFDAVPAAAPKHDVPLPHRQPRWLTRRKAEAAAAMIEGDAVSPEDACGYFNVGLDQVAACRRAAARGVAAQASATSLLRFRWGPARGRSI